MTFIDDYSEKTWIYFLKTRDEVFIHFQEFKALVENSRGRKIKAIHTYNGGYYMEKSFKEFYAKEGIKRE